MYPTAEIRWFFEGTVPPEVRQWLQLVAPAAEQQPVRVDQYLCLESSDTLGIKLREGRLEVKQRQQDHGLVDLHERVSGKIETWRKWSFWLASADASQAGHDVGASAWISVRKRRRLGRFLLNDQGSVVAGAAAAVTAAATADRGCELELASIVVGGKEWWTVAFEAFGEEAANVPNLRLVADQILAAHEPPMLEAIHCHSYPQWLAMIAPLENT